MMRSDYTVVVTWRPTDPNHLKRWHWRAVGLQSYPEYKDGWCWTPTGAERAAKRVVWEDAAKRTRIEVRVNRGRTSDA